MASVNRSGVEICYEERGSGPAILLSHGYSSTSHMWQGQLEALSGDHHVIAWDMRGHGQTDSPDDQAEYSEQATVEDMAAVLDACGEDRAVIGGLSLGGYMSLAFHLAYPARTRALMLFDTGPGYNNPKGREAWNETANRRADRFEADGLAAAGRGAEVQQSRHRSADGLARSARGMLAQFDDRVIKSLPNVGVPSLVLVGENDEPFLAATDYMAAKIPDAAKVVIADAGHAANIDRPEAFNSAVREFLAGLPD
jgi:pimeloyl-ACP methyl ester carboxylesterase